MKSEMEVALSNLSGSRVAAMIATRRTTSADLVEACLDRIGRREAVVNAWSYLDPAAARRQARESDAAEQAGPLRGVPVAVKDVIDVAGMPTGMGSPIYDGYRPFVDAACVAALRAAGAVILGKTVTAEFAGVFPGATTNPLKVDHTPGGSSSGSAAAVADGMVPVALGTQTGGSILRPAAYCGIIGFKPSFGSINRAGLKLAAESLDTIGLLAREVEDIELFWNVLVGRRNAPSSSLAAPRLALFRTHHWSKASEDTVAAIEDAVLQLRDAGAVIEEMPVPKGFAELSEARVVINGYERARALAWESQHHADRLSPALARVVTDGWSFSFEQYRDAVRVAERWRSWIDERVAAYDAILTAAVSGEAPSGLASTGDASFQEIWTILHMPAITLPLSIGRAGLPVGVQFVGRRHDDAALLQLARWVMRDRTPTVPQSPG
jgi:amidase